MTDGNDLKLAVPMAFGRHPATLGASGWFAAAYPAPPHPHAEPGIPGFEIWLPEARFAPLGPASVSLSTQFTLVPVQAPAPVAAQSVRETVSVLPEAELDEVDVLERIADVADPQGSPLADADVVDDAADEPIVESAIPPEPQQEEIAAHRPEGADLSGPADLPEISEWPLDDAVPHAPAHPLPEPALEPTAEFAAPPPEERSEPPANIAPEAAPQAAYWATTPAADSLAWVSPPASGPADARLTTPAMAGLWSAEPADGAEEMGPVAPGRPVRRPTTRTLGAIAAAIVVVVAAGIGGAMLLPRLLASNDVPAATFNAPMMVLRANSVGRISNVAIKNGQTVEPNTVLMTIHTDPQPDPATSLLQDRLEAARGRLAALDDALGQSIPNTDAGRARVADLRRQRSAAATDVAQFQDGLNAMPPKPPADLPVVAGIHGIIRSLEAQAGMATASGVPLVRMLDCDHAFLTTAPNAKLQAGQTVQVRLANLPPVRATVRKSSGIAEPPDSLVIAPAPGAFIGILSGSCPVGATATVTPSIAGS